MRRLGVLGVKHGVVGTEAGNLAKVSSSAGSIVRAPHPGHWQGGLCYSGPIFSSFGSDNVEHCWIQLSSADENGKNFMNVPTVGTCHIVMISSRTCVSALASAGPARAESTFA